MNKETIVVTTPLTDEDCVKFLRNIREARKQVDTIRKCVRELRTKMREINREADRMAESVATGIYKEKVLCTVVETAYERRWVRDDNGKVAKTERLAGPTPTEGEDAATDPVV